MEQSINFKTKNYFEGVIYVMGWVFGFIALCLILTNWFLTPIFGFLAFLILTAQYKLTINLDTKEIEDFLLIIGLKTQNEKFKYSTLEYIYITQSKYTQRMNMESLSSTISGELYNAYLKSDVANIFLGESKNLAELKKKIGPLADQLKLEVKNA
jgi:hypothetical protein